MNDMAADRKEAARLTEALEIYFQVYHHEGVK